MSATLHPHPWICVKDGTLWCCGFNHSKLESVTDRLGRWSFDRHIGKVDIDIDRLDGTSYHITIPDVDAVGLDDEYVEGHAESGDILTLPTIDKAAQVA